MMSKEAMKLALDALKRMKRYGNTFGYRSHEQNPYEQVCEAITALEALAKQPAQQEPVTGCVCRWNSEGDRVVTCERHQGWLEVIAEWADRARDAEKKLKALNTSPPAQRKPWVGLTHEERLHFLNAILDYGAGFVSPLDAVICNIEAKLREKNA